jgi:uncharacterized membrane protein
MHRLRKYLIAGLLVWLPLVATGLVVNILMDILKWFMGFIPEQYQPQALAPFPIPGLDLAIIFLILIVILLLTGMIAANLFGRKLVKLWENFLGRIPLVRTVYKGFKQVTETIFSSSGKSFRKVLMIEYPRKGIWTLCFQTGNSVGEVQERTGTEVVTVFVPTTPNPTSGFIILVPRKDVVELDMNVDQALKMIISLGVIEPQWNGKPVSLTRPAEVAEEPPRP